MSEHIELSIDEQIALQQENEELRAHVERLRELLSEIAGEAAIYCQRNGSDVTWMNKAFHVLADTYDDKQSLQSIKAEVEEEVIERCANTLNAPDQILRLHSSKRKYSTIARNAGSAGHGALYDTTHWGIGKDTTRWGKGDGK